MYLFYFSSNESLSDYLLALISPHYYMGPIRVKPHFAHIISEKHFIVNYYNKCRHSITKLNSIKFHTSFTVCIFFVGHLHIIS